MHVPLAINHPTRYSIENSIQLSKTSITLSDKRRCICCILESRGKDEKIEIRDCSCDEQIWDRVARHASVDNSLRAITLAAAWHRRLSASWCCWFALTAHANEREQRSQRDIIPGRYTRDGIALSFRRFHDNRETKGTKKSNVTSHHRNKMQNMMQNAIDRKIRQTWLNNLVADD